MEAKRKFTFPQADGEMHNYMLNTFQMSRSTDALRAKDEKADSRLSLQWPEGGQNSSRKKEQCNRKKSLLERLGVSLIKNLIRLYYKSVAVRTVNYNRTCHFVASKCSRCGKIRDL